MMPIFPSIVKGLQSNRYDRYRKSRKTLFVSPETVLTTPYIVNGVSALNLLDHTEKDIIFLPGTYYDQFTINGNDVRLVFEEGVLFNGTESLNGENTLNSSWNVAQASKWVLVDSGLNVWKKPCGYVPWLFLSGEWLEPMATSVNTNSAATILSNIAVHEFTIRDESNGAGISSHIYIRLDSGETPSMFDIRAPQSTKVPANEGMVYAKDKHGISIEGVLETYGCYGVSTASVKFENCTDVQTLNKYAIKTSYSYVPVDICGGDRVRLSADCSYAFNSIRVSAAKTTANGIAGPYVVGDYYTAGEIEVYDWRTNYLGWQPRYIGTQIAWDTDSDGGVSVGYRGGQIRKCIIRDGECHNGGPLSYTMKSGWDGAASTAAKGSGVYIGTSDPLKIDSVEINNILVKDTKRIGVFVGGTNVDIGDVTVTNVTMDNIVGVPIATNSQQAILNIGETLATSRGGRRIIKNNRIVGGSHSLAAAQFRRANANAAYQIDFSQNIVDACAVESGYTSFGNFRIGDAFGLTGAEVDRNFATGPVGGVYGRNNATNYATLATWQAAGFDVNGGQL